MRKVVFAAVLTPILATAALAQNAASPGQPATPDNKTPAMSDKTTDANPTMAKPAADVPGKGPDFIGVPQDAMLSGNVVGLDVYNKENNDVGKIHDMIVAPDNSVKGYILSVGGFLGMGTRYVAVDPGAVKIVFDDNQKVWRAAINATKDQLKGAPEFHYDGRWNASRS
jgi:hypothetical protein